MTYGYVRSASNRSIGDTVTADRMNEINTDLSSLFQRLDDRDLSLTYSLGLLTTIVDNINGITVNVDATNLETLGYIEIQESGDPKKYMINYVGGYPSTIVYDL